MIKANETSFKLSDVPGISDSDTLLVFSLPTPVFSESELESPFPEPESESSVFGGTTSPGTSWISSL